jgi:hypothetical protein
MPIKGDNRHFNVSSCFASELFNNSAMAEVDSVVDANGGNTALW